MSTQPTLNHTLDILLSNANPKGNYDQLETLVLKEIDDIRILTNNAHREVLNLRERAEINAGIETSLDIYKEVVSGKLPDIAKFIDGFNLALKILKSSDMISIFRVSSSTYSSIQGKLANVQNILLTGNPSTLSKRSNSETTAENRIQPNIQLYRTFESGLGFALDDYEDVLLRAKQHIITNQVDSLSNVVSQFEGKDKNLQTFIDLSLSPVTAAYQVASTQVPEFIEIYESVLQDVNQSKLERLAVYIGFMALLDGRFEAEITQFAIDYIDLLIVTNRAMVQSINASLELSLNVGSQPLVIVKDYTVNSHSGVEDTIHVTATVINSGSGVAQDVSAAILYDTFLYPLLPDSAFIGDLQSGEEAIVYYTFTYSYNDSIVQNSTTIIVSPKTSNGLAESKAIEIPIESEDVTSVQEATSTKTPESFHISQNYPNPFNPETKIQYQLHVDSEVMIKIYDIIGQEVVTLLDARKQAGLYEITWGGRGKNGMMVSSGIYLIRVQAGNFVATKKMVLLR